MLVGLYFICSYKIVVYVVYNLYKICGNFLMNERILNGKVFFI